MAIWMDGQITAISDRRQKPVYTFTKANVKDGIFSYEGTGEKVKVNQIKLHGMIQQIITNKQQNMLKIHKPLYQVQQVKRLDL